MNLHQPLGFAPAGDPVNFLSTCSSTLTDPRLCDSSWAACLKFWSIHLSLVCLGRETNWVKCGLIVENILHKDNFEVNFHKLFLVFFSGTHLHQSYLWYVCLPTGCVYLSRERLWPGDRHEAHTFSSASLPPSTPPPREESEPRTHGSANSKHICLETELAKLRDRLLWKKLPRNMP